MIKFATDITLEAVQFISENIKWVGTLESIRHERHRRKMYYKTIFTGSDKTLEIYSGITSGYVGAGPDGFYKVLVELGVAEEIAKKEVYEAGEEEYEFEIFLGN